MKKKIIGLLIGLHLFFIVTVAVHLYDFMRRYSFFAPVTLVIDYYSSVTFNSRNFGFFAPDVAGDWNVIMKLTDNKKNHSVRRFETTNREMKNKFYSMTGHFGSSDDSMDLFARSWALKIMNEMPEIIEVQVEVYENMIPTMKEYQKGKRISRKFLYSATFTL